MKKKTPAKPRNYTATEATLRNNRKTRRDITALNARLTALEMRLTALEAPPEAAPLDTP